MFGNLIDGSQNAVWRFAFEGKIPKNYENRSKMSLLIQYNILSVDYKSAFHQIKAELKFKQFAFLASSKVQPRRIIEKNGIIFIVIKLFFHQSSDKQIGVESV